MKWIKYISIWFTQEYTKNRLYHVVILYRLFIFELSENMLYREIYCYRDIKWPILGQKILGILPSPSCMCSCPIGVLYVSVCNVTVRHHPIIYWYILVLTMVLLVYGILMVYYYGRLPGTTWYLAWYIMVHGMCMLWTTKVHWYQCT